MPQTAHAGKAAYLPTGGFYDLLAITGCAARFEQDGQAEELVNLGISSQLIAHWDKHGSSRNFNLFQEYLRLVRDGAVGGTMS